MKIIETYNLTTNIRDRITPTGSARQAFLETALRSVNGSPAVIIPEQTFLDLTYAPDPVIEKMPALDKDLKTQIDHLLTEHLGVDVAKAMGDKGLFDSAAHLATREIARQVSTSTVNERLQHENLPEAALTVLEEMRTQVDFGELQDSTHLDSASIVVVAEESDPVPTSIRVEMENANSITCAEGMPKTANTVSIELPVALTLRVGTNFNLIEIQHPYAVNKLITWDALRPDKVVPSHEAYFELFDMAKKHRSLAMDTFLKVRSTKWDGDRW